IFSVMCFRMIGRVVIIIITVEYVMIYARKVKKNPELSIMYKFDQKRNFGEQAKEQTLNNRQLLIISVLGLTIIGLALGVMFFDWYITEIAGLFLLMGLIIGFIGKISIIDIDEA